MRNLMLPYVFVIHFMKKNRKCKNGLRTTRPGTEPGLAESPQLSAAAIHLEAELEVQSAVLQTQTQLQ